MIGTVSSTAEIVVRAVSGAAGAGVVAGTVTSAIKTVVLPRPERLRLSRVWFVGVGRLFELFAKPGRTFEDRDRVMSMYPPVALVLLPLVWAGLCTAGFTGVHWAVEGRSVRDAFLASGSSMFTLGTVFHRDLPSASVSFLQAAVGLIIIALLISYLPSIYGAYQRRETLVAMLESRAGSPPSPYEMLVRYARIGALERIDEDLFRPWEQWFVDVEESHSSIVMLVFFRSPRMERSWITAAGCVLDTASLYLSCVDLPFSPSGALCLRSGFLSLRRLAGNFNIAVDHDPSPDGPVTVTRREFDLMWLELHAAGLPLKSDRDRAWADFCGWRVNYDAALVGLAKLVVAPDARWSSDRDGERVTPTMRDRRR
jgi:hypothetical protein